MNNTRKTAIDEPGNVVESEKLEGEAIKEEECDVSPLKKVESFGNALCPSIAVSAIFQHRDSETDKDFFKGFLFYFLDELR
jgi:hypothetical protein